MYGGIDEAIAKNIPSVKTTFPVESKILTEGGKPFMSEGVKETQRAVNIVDIKSFAQGIIDKLPEDVRVAIGKGGSEADNFYTQLRDMASLPDNLRFEDAAFYRSQLLSTVRKSGGIVNPRDIGMAKKLGSMMGNAEKRTAAQYGVLDEYNAVNEFYSKNIEKFHNTLIKKIADVEPEKLALSVIRPRNAESIKEIRAAVGEKGFENIKRLALQDWVEQSMANTEDAGLYLSGKKLVGEWRKLGPETKNAAFSPYEQSEISSILESTAKFETSPVTPGLWGMSQISNAMLGTGAILGGAGGATVGGVAGGIAGAGAITLAPTLFMKMISSRQGRKFLTEGFKVPRGGKEAVNFMGRFGAWMANENSKK